LPVRAKVTIFEVRVVVAVGGIPPSLQVIKDKVVNPIMGDYDAKSKNRNQLPITYNKESKEGRK